MDKISYIPGKITSNIKDNTDLIMMAPAYLLVTNKYLIPMIPYIFGIIPGDPYYPILRNLFLFIGTFAITLIIWHHHNKKSSDEELKKIHTTISDSLKMVLTVLFLYFIISIIFPGTQLIKLKFEHIFNSIFYIIGFGLIGFLYGILGNIMPKLRKTHKFKTGGMATALFILYILYIIFDPQITGSIPGLDLIPLKFRNMINIAIKLTNGIRGDDEYINKLIKELTKSGELTATEVNKLIKLSFMGLKLIPEPGILLLDKISNQTAVLDKILGPIDISNASNISSYISHPLIKLFLEIIP